MSGKQYGAIQVHQEAESDGGEEISARSPHRSERIPLLLPSLVTKDKQTAASISVAVQTDPTKLTQTVDFLRQLWSDTTFNWISPLLETGNAHGQLDVSDLETLPLPRTCETRQVYAQFVKCWSEELDKARRSRQAEGGDRGGNSDNNSLLYSNSAASRLLLHPSAYQPSLIRALAKAFGSDFLRAGIFKLIHDVNIFVGPQVLNHLIQFFRSDAATAPLHRGVWLTLLVTFSQICMSITLRHYFYKCYTCGLQIRTAVVIAVYQKSLQISLKERHNNARNNGGRKSGGGGSGEIVNLVGIDAQRMQDLMTYLHAVWYSFLQIGLAMYFLWGQVGPSCLAGVVVIVVLIPGTKFIASWLSRIQKVLMKARDERVALNNELLGAMKVRKLLFFFPMLLFFPNYYYDVHSKSLTPSPCSFSKIVKIQAWEENFRSKLTNLRNNEMFKLKRYFIVSAVSVSLYTSTPLLVSLATFAAYTMIGQNHLDVAQALTAIALFDILRFPLFMLPQIINKIVEASISFERVREFLLAEEHKSVGEGTLEQNGEIYINNGTFVYDSKKPTLVQGGWNEVGEGGKGFKRKGGFRGLMQTQTRLMQEAALDQQWEIALLRAQLLDAEKTIAKLSGDTKATSHSISIDENEEEGEFSPSSLLSLRRVTMQCKRGEFVAVVGAVGEIATVPLAIFNCLSI